MRLLAVILAFSLAVAQGQTPVQVPQVPQVVTSLTAEEMEAILKEAGYRYERVKEGAEVFFSLRIGGLRALLFLTDCNGGRCGSLQLFAGFKMGKPPTLERINAWNREKRFSRAYLDKDGDPVLESELDLEGGVTRQAIISFLETFEISLSRFATWIGFQ
jgi:hypothetical protein